MEIVSEVFGARVKMCSGEEDSIEIESFRFSEKTIWCSKVYSELFSKVNLSSSEIF
jgi:hypothetical protein